jgi:hypothetical protein
LIVTLTTLTGQFRLYAAFSREKVIADAGAGFC